MKNSYSFAAYILIGLGIYFLFNLFNIPLLKNIDFTTALPFIIGLLLLLKGYREKQSEILISGSILLGIAIHFYGLATINNWSSHWGIYILIIGIALFINFLRSKQGLVISVIIIALALLFISSTKLNNAFEAFFSLFGMASTYWPLIFIALGLLLLKVKK